MLAEGIVTYREVLQDSREPVTVRLKKVRRYRETGNISQVAREFGTTRRSVRKWVGRFDGSIASLRNASRAPKEPRRHLGEETIEALVAFRREHPSLGYDYIHHWLLERGIAEIPSKCTVYAIWRRYGLIKRSLRKHTVDGITR